MSGSGRKVGSSNFLNQQRLAEACVANEVIARISLRWKMSVLYSIDTGARSFAELKRVHPTLSDHILAARLRELRREAVILSTPRRREARPCWRSFARCAPGAKRSPPRLPPKVFPAETK
jgi:hypothetical protein